MVTLKNSDQGFASSNHTGTIFFYQLKVESCVIMFVCLFVCLIWFFTSHQQSFSYKGTGHPGWSSTKLGLKPRSVMIDFQNTCKILYNQWGFSFQSRFSWNICTLARIKQREKEIIISIFIAGSSLIMATPRKIYDTVSKTIILNVFKYYKKIKREYILLNMKDRSKKNVKNIRKNKSK